MDPLKALQSLDKLAAAAPLDRAGHEHVRMCVTAIAEALARLSPPSSE